MIDRLLTSRAVFVVICGLIGILFLTSNLPWQLDDYDQAKQAYTSFEMVNAGSWLYQHTPHDRIATKPPLIGWISAAIYEVTRSWNLAWRLPSLGAAIALTILLFRAGSAYGTAGGVIAMSAFAFNLLTPRLASLVRTDMALALAVSLIGFLIWQKIRDAQGWSGRDRVLLFGLLTAAMLIKGPIVYAFLLPGILLMILFARGRVAQMRGCGWWPWLASLSIFLVWVIAGSKLVPQFFDQVVGHEFLGRFGETEHRPQPFYFYWPHVLHKFAPWSLLLIAFAILDFRGHSEPDRLNRSSWRSWFSAERIRPETIWLLGWSLGGLIVMSIIPSKRVDRIFPIVPPLCLLVAAQVAQGRVAIQRWVAITLAVSILYTSAYTVFKITTGYRDNRDALVRFGEVVRKEVTSKNWRYEIVNASDEGLLLYLQKLHFLKSGDAVALWNRNELDALILPEKNSGNIIPQLAGAVTSPIRTAERKDERGGYILVTR